MSIAAYELDEIIQKIVEKLEKVVFDEYSSYNRIRVKIDALRKKCSSEHKKKYGAVSEI